MSCQADPRSAAAVTRKILLVKLSSLGDIVHTMPTLHDLHQALPNAQIDWVVESAFAALLGRCAGVHRVITCDLRRWRSAPWSRTTRLQWRQFKADLQQDSYAAVIDLQGLSKSALVAWLARLERHGKRYAMANQTDGSSFEAPTRWVADVAIRVPTHSHAVARARALCGQALAYDFAPTPRYGLAGRLEQAPLSVRNAALQAGPRGVVALIHGSSRSDKQWPLAHWRELIKRLLADGYSVALPHGSRAEEAVAQQLAQDFAQTQVWPRLRLDALTDALATCAGVIGVDSGLSHLAVALDLPVVQIYNFDTAWRTGPVPAAGQHAAHQRCVFTQPMPTVEAVWQAWEMVAAAHWSRLAGTGFTASCTVVPLRP